MKWTRVTRTAVVCGLGSAGWLLACGSSSEGGSTVADAGHAATPDAGAAAPDARGPDLKLPDPAICAGIATCQTCCDTNFAGGAQLIRLAEIDCACTGASSCGSLCSQNECNSLSSKSPACDNCLIAAITGECVQPVQTQCAADATCKIYQTCLAGCP